MDLLLKSCQWVVVNGGRYILGCGGWWRVVVDMFWLVVGGGGWWWMVVDIFWLVVRGGGWWWIVVDRGGSCWHSLV